MNLFVLKGFPKNLWIIALMEEKKQEPVEESVEIPGRILGY